MKKTLAVILALLLAFSLTACGKKGNSTVAEIGDYKAEYKGCEVIKDCDGNDAVALFFNYTNGSNEANSFVWSMFYTVKQGGTELEHAVVFESEDSYDTLDEDTFTEVEPSESLPVCITYKLNDLTTDVEIEFSEIIGNDTATIVAKLSESGSEEGGSEENEDALSSSEAINFWSGDWYGWWTIFDGDGYYGDYVNEAWDCCAYVEPTGEGHLLTIWDEDYNDYYEDCLAEITLEIDPDTGIATSAGEGNYFWYGDVPAGDMVIDPAEAGYDNMLVIEGSFIDEEGEYCEYGVVLTKMGYEWNEDAVAAPDYYDYFLGLMEEGEELPTLFDPSV